MGTPRSGRWVCQREDLQELRRKEVEEQYNVDVHGVPWVSLKLATNRSVFFFTRGTVFESIIHQYLRTLLFTSHSRLYETIAIFCHPEIL